MTIYAEYFQGWYWIDNADHILHISFMRMMHITLYSYHFQMQIMFYGMSNTLCMQNVEAELDLQSNIMQNYNGVLQITPKMQSAIYIITKNAECKRPGLQRRTLRLDFPFKNQKRKWARQTQGLLL